mmetsp:Transcript_19914/g.57194  ORF Transcript_19914/g.57194 Transcript_19914/m.57194 type:complete len:280 (+) Transcript_19914:220-1059(+)
MSESSEEATVTCSTSKGQFKMKFYRKWSPNGYDRAVELFERGFYDQSHFFRVLPGFLVQFGISYTDDKELKKFARQTIPDDPHLPELRQVRPGLISFAGSGKNSRDTQLFISYSHAKSLGTMDWETAVGEVIEGFEETIKKLNSEYKEEALQGRIHSKGKDYIEQEFPFMDFFEQCHVQRSSANDRSDGEGGEGRGHDAEAKQIGTEDTGKPSQIIADEKDINVIAEGESQKFNSTPGRLGTQASDTNYPLFLFLALSFGFVLVVAKKRLFGTERRKRI